MLLLESVTTKHKHPSKDLYPNDLVSYLDIMYVDTEGIFITVTFLKKVSLNLPLSGDGTLDIISQGTPPSPPGYSESGPWPI